MGGAINAERKCDDAGLQEGTTFFKVGLRKRVDIRYYWGCRRGIAGTEGAAEGVHRVLEGLRKPE